MVYYADELDNVFNKMDAKGFFSMFYNIYKTISLIDAGCDMEGIVYDIIAFCNKRECFGQ